MLNGILSLIGILILFLVVALILPKESIPGLIAQGIIWFLMIYVINTGILLWFNIFSIVTAVVATDVEALVIALFLALIKKEKPQFGKGIGDGIMCLIIFGIVMIAVWNRFGFYGLGQDEGTYQTRAIAYMNDINDNFITFNEYDSLGEGEKLGYAANMDTRIQGFYFANEDEFNATGGSTQSGTYNSVTGVIHGISAFPALLAWFGSIFGLVSMSGFQVLVLLLSIILIYELFTRLKIKRILVLCGTWIYASCPLVIWMAKGTLVELFLAVIVMEFMYLIICAEEKELYEEVSSKVYKNFGNGYDESMIRSVAIWTALPIMAFAFYHPTIYVMLPIFIVVFVLLYFRTQKMSYISAGILSTVAYYCGFRMMYISEYRYTIGNYDRLYIGPVNETNILTFIGIACGATIVALLVIAIIGKAVFKKINAKPKYDMYREKPKKSTVFMMWLVRIVAIVSAAFSIYVMLTGNFTWNKMTIYAYIASTGLILIPIIFIAVLARPQWFYGKIYSLVFSVLFLYTVIIYSGILKTEIPYYYYYARYIVPFLAVIIVMAMDIISKALKQEKTGNAAMLVSVVLIIFYTVIMGKYNLTLVNQKDETHISYSTLQQVTEKVKSGDAVIVDSGMIDVLQLPVKFITGADVYPSNQNNEGLIEQISKTHENVYYITIYKDELHESQKGINTGRLRVDLENVLRIEDKSWMDYATSSELVDVDYAGTFIPYSYRFASEDIVVSMYKCKMR